MKKEWAVIFVILAVLVYVEYTRIPRTVLVERCECDLCIEGEY
jgi:hypothetical protein